MVDLKSKIQEENVISRELLWTPASICRGKKFYLGSNPLMQTTDEATTGLLFFCLGSTGVYLSCGPTAEGLSLIKLWGFCSAFPITSSTASSKRAQEYFSESSSCKVEMVRLEDLSDL